MATALHPPWPYALWLVTAPATSTATMSAMAAFASACGAHIAAAFCAQRRGPSHEECECVGLVVQLSLQLRTSASPCFGRLLADGYCWPHDSRPRAGCLQTVAYNWPPSTIPTTGSVRLATYSRPPLRTVFY